MLFTNNFLSVSLERKEELRDMAIYVNGLVMELFNANYFPKNGYHPSASQKLDKAYSYFKTIYNAELSTDDRNIFNLYILFPDDAYFMDLVNKYNKDFDKIAVFFNIKSGIVKLRYLLQRNIESEKKYYEEELNAEEEEAQVKTK